MFQESAIAANLQAIAGDVDLGSLTGVQFEQVGDKVTLGIFATVTGTLLNFQVEVDIDPSFLLADTGSESIGFPSTVVTLNSPPRLVRILANEPRSTYSGENIHLASVTLSVVGGGVTLITGTIVELISKSGGSQFRVSDRAIDAGTGYAVLALASSRRRLSVPSQTRSPEIALAARNRRSLSYANHLQSCTPCAVNGTGVRGDVNGDCKLSSFDVFEASQLFLQREARGLAGEVPSAQSSLCYWRQKQLDLTLDGIFSLADVQYLMYSVAGKFRFADNFGALCSRLAPEPGAVQDIVISVNIFDDDGSPSTNFTTVRMEIARPPGAIANVSQGVNLGYTPAGNWLTSAAGDPNGNFAVTIRPSNMNWSPETQVSVAFMVETTDYFGGSDLQRNVPFKGSSEPLYAQFGFSFDPLAKFPGCLPPPSPPPPSPPPSPMQPMCCTCSRRRSRVWCRRRSSPSPRAGTTMWKTSFCWLRGSQPCRQTGSRSKSGWRRSSALSLSRRWIVLTVTSPRRRACSTCSVRP